MCSIIDAFHFSITSQVPETADSAVAAESGAAADPGDDGDMASVDGDTDAAARQDAEAECAHRDIQAALTKRVLPGLRGQLVQDGEVWRKAFGRDCNVFCCGRNLGGLKMRLGMGLGPTAARASGGCSAHSW